MEPQNPNEARQLEENPESKIRQAAQELFFTNPDWVTFFRQILGRYGIVRTNYPSNEALLEFQHTETYAEIQQMLAKLREQGLDPENSPESVKVITVRIPESLHDLLRGEADGLHASVNKLCISKLLQVIDKELVPEEAIIRANVAKAKKERERLKQEEAEQETTAQETEGEAAAEGDEEEGREEIEEALAEIEIEEVEPEKEEVGEDV